MVGLLQVKIEVALGKNQDPVTFSSTEMLVGIWNFLLSLRDLWLVATLESDMDILPRICSFIFCVRMIPSGLNNADRQTVYLYLGMKWCIYGVLVNSRY